MAGKFEVAGVGWFDSNGRFLGKGPGGTAKPTLGSPRVATGAPAPVAKADPNPTEGGPGSASAMEAFNDAVRAGQPGGRFYDLPSTFAATTAAAPTSSTTTTAPRPGAPAAAPLKPVDAEPLSRLDSALSGLTRATSGGGEMSVDEQRRRAFLDAPDSMSGLKAAKGVMAKAAGIESDNPQTLSMKGLEQAYEGRRNKEAIDDVVGLALEGKAYDNAVAENPQLGGLLAGRTAPAVWRPSEADASNFNFKVTPQLMDRYLQSDTFKNSLTRPDGTINDQVQLGLREDPDLATSLSSYAALGMKPPKKPEDQMLNPGLLVPTGKPGNTLSLGFYDASQLPALNSGIRVSAPSEFRNPFDGGEHRGYWA